MINIHRRQAQGPSVKASTLPGRGVDLILGGRSYARSALIHGGGIGGNEMYYPFLGGAIIAILGIMCGYVLMDIWER